MRDKQKKQKHDNTRRNLQRDKIRAIKLARGCADCGYAQHPAALDFDHLSNKSFAIAQGRDRKWTLILEEIAKCDVVCANCHRIRTVNRRALTGKSPLPTDLSVE